MRITVFGATGRIGRHLLAEGPRRGHQPTAFTRRPHFLADPAALAAVVHGDARDPQAVGKALDGADAVISTISPASRNGPYPVAEASQEPTMPTRLTPAIRWYREPRGGAARAA